MEGALAAEIAAREREQILTQTLADTQERSMSCRPSSGSGARISGRHTAAAGIERHPVRAHSFQSEQRVQRVNCTGAGGSFEQARAAPTAAPGAAPPRRAERHRAAPRHRAASVEAATMRNRLTAAVVAITIAARPRMLGSKEAPAPSPPRQHWPPGRARRRDAPIPATASRTTAFLTAYVSRSTAVTGDFDEMLKRRRSASASPSTARTTSSTKGGSVG